MAIRLPSLDQLPDGALRAFVVALHELYDQAGQPAARLISKDISGLPRRFETVSHQTISAMLHGATPPAWAKVKSIVVALAVRAELGVDERDLDRRFKALWVEARSAPRTRPPDPAEPPGIPTQRPAPATVRPPRPSMQSDRLSIRPPGGLRSRIELAPAAPVDPIVGGLPERDVSFTGREALLDRMRAELLENPHAPLVLHGLSGVGKTQLAREYVERHRHQHQITWWVQAEYVERARRSLLDLADRLGASIWENADQTIDRVISQLESQPVPYLLVFDGVNDDEVRRLMPTFGGHVIVTTRDPARGHENTSIGIEVPDFTVPEAVAFLRKRDSALSEEQAEELVGKIGRLPLALEHIAALRQAPGLSWEELQRRLEDSTVDVSPAASPYPYPPGVLASIRVALEAFAAANPSAMLVLELFAWLGSEPVSVALLRQGRAGDVSAALQRALRNSVDLSKALRAIQQFGLARLYADQRVEVQPVTRRALRDVLPAEALKRARRNAHEILAAADQGKPDDVVSSGMHREIAAHVLAVDLIRSDLPAALRTVYHQVRYRYVIGDYAGARDLADTAVTVWRADPGVGPGDELVLQTIHEWANALRALGKYQDARDLTADAMSRLRSDPVYGEDHPLTLASSSSHASDLRLSGEYRRALEIDFDTLGRCQRVHGEADPATTNRRHNLAVSLRHVGDFAAAETADRETLADRRERYGVDDWRTQLSVNALAEDLYGLGRYAQVLELRGQHAGSGRRLSGQVDRGALLYRRTQGMSQRGLGAFAEARELLGEHYRECNVAFGADHEYTLAAMVSYANTLRLCGDAQEAYVYASDAVAAYIRTFGRRNPLTLAAQVNLAAIRRAQGDRSLAQQIDAVASEALRDTLGERHPFTIAAIANLATDYALAGGHALAARALSAGAYAKAREVRGEDHPDTLTIGANLVLDLAAAGETDESAELRDEVITTMHRVLGSEHPMVAEVAQERRIESVIEPPTA
ncbi:FxSxx-COOH system tetratricopeptide repeat protein [Actinomycetes bacterium KLBMP 9797]